MPDELIVRHCSPTLAGLKTGSLFSYNVEDISRLMLKMRALNSMLNSKGVYLRILDLKKGRALIYVFRPSRLARDLERPFADNLLRRAGYPLDSLISRIAYLSDRLRTSSEFPHEIGLFLGYPTEDIKGFIENKGRNCKCVGCWKVYANESEAKKTFAVFRKCTDIYCRKLNEGSSITKLTITVCTR